MDKMSGVYLDNRLNDILDFAEQMVKGMVRSLATVTDYEFVRVDEDSKVSTTREIFNGKVRDGVRSICNIYGVKATVLVVDVEVGTMLTIVKS